jgi:glycosyltransferase involved in cell wall biosynthesis
MVHDIVGVAAVQSRILREAGHEVDQIPLSELGASWKWPLKAITIPLRLASYLPTIAKLRGNPYDVVHIHWLSQGIIGLLIGRPFFAQAHGSDLHVNMGNPVLRKVTRMVLAKARLVFYVTPDLPAYAPGFDEKFRFLPNPVEVDDNVAPPPTRVAKAVIFTRLAPVKGVDRIFPGAEKLRQSVELTALDWGPLAGEYVQRYSGLVRFVRPIPHSEVGSFLKQFDVVIGQMQSGNLGLSELEAMAAGRPVITGIDWSFYPDDPPPVIAATDADGIAAAIEKLKNDERELARLARAGREWVIRNHGFALHLHLLEAAYFGAPTSS